MMNPLLNIAPQTLVHGRTTESADMSRTGDAGDPVLLASFGPATVDGDAASMLRFDAMLRDAVFPAAPAAPVADASQQALDPARDETLDAALDAGAYVREVSAHGADVHATALRVRGASAVESEPVFEAMTHETAPALAPIGPVFAATFVSGEAIAARESIAPTVTQGGMAVSLATMPLLATAALQASLPHDAPPALLASAAPADPGSTRPENALLQLASQSVSSAAATLAVLGGEPAATRVSDRLDSPARQPLETLLGERLQVQIARRSEHALVRLDPPSMGTIEIVIRQEGAHLHVHLRASNSEVARQLQVIGETLRQDLVQRQHGDVSVQVWDSSREGEHQRRRATLVWQDEPGRALNDEAEEHRSFAINTASE